jgi:hypothetical protein
MQSFFSAAISRRQRCCASRINLKRLSDCACGSRLSIQFPMSMPAKILMSLVVVLLAMGMIFCLGCAKIAEPQAPEVRVPKAAVDLTAYQRSDYIVLTVSMPVQNTNGSAVTTLRGMEVYRLAEDATKNPSSNPLSEEQFEKRAAPILSISAARLSSHLHEKSLVVEDRLFLPDKSTFYSSAFRYAVLFVNNRNQTAGFSNQTLIAPLPIPAPPGGLAANVTERSINLKWMPPSENMDGSKPARIAGYKVYRSEEPDKFPGVPVSINPISKPELEDNNFQFDKTYYYAVSVVGSLQNPYAESLASESLTVVSRDVFAPFPPKDFNAILAGGIVILFWTPSSSPDVAGYRIYRREEGATDRQLLQSELITSFSFRDTRAASDRKYEYSILSVDTHGNESIAVRTGVEAR